MWVIFLLHLIFTSTLQSELSDILATTDELWEEHYLANDLIDTEHLKSMLKRTYDLNDELEQPKRKKRSTDEEMLLYKDGMGVQLLSNIQDVNRIPVKFPNDLDIITSHNLLYIAALEANGTNPETQPSNDLVLFHYSSIQGIKEMGRVPVLGGVKLASHSFQNSTYIIAAEQEAEENPDLHQGSTLYRMSEQNGRVSLEKVQIINAVRPNVVVFWEHQDQFYLAVGTSMGNTSERTGTLVYRWSGHHFNRIQVIPSKNVKSLAPFVIGSFMYLAVAHFQDEHGNVDTKSPIYKFKLNEMKFEPFQQITTHGARDVSSFYFENPETKEKEHFLVVANSLGKTNGVLTSLRESVVYKYEDDRFVPFQSFRLNGATQWLPIQGPNKEFLLLGSYAGGVVGYQYDGWRFSPVSLIFGQSFFGRNIQSMKGFYYFGDLFLTVADKSSYGTDVNLWKLSFTNKNDLKKHYEELESWCSTLEANIEEDGDVLDDFDPEEVYSGENLLLEDSESAEVRTEVRGLREETENLEKLVEEVEERVKEMKKDGGQSIAFDSRELDSFEFHCERPNCLKFERLTLGKMNGENFTEFLSEVVPTNDNLETSVLQFQNVRLENGLTSAMVNGHPAETLVDVSSDIFLNGGLVVNGTVFVNDNLIVHGLFNGVEPESLKSTGGVQDLEEEIVVNNLKVKNLTITGNLNGESIAALTGKPALNLPTNFKELSVNNMYVNGLVGGYNMTEVFEKVLKNSGDQVIEGDFNVKTLEADEVEVDSNELSNIPMPKIFEAVEQSRCLLEFAEVVDSPQPRESEAKDLADEYIIIVEGNIKVRDVSDETNSTSLLDIVTNSIRLNDTVIDTHFTLPNVETDELEFDVVNDIPFSSMLLNNNGEARYVRGTKTFQNGVHVEKEAFAERINGIDLEELKNDVITLDEDQTIRADVHFHSVRCFEVNSNFTSFGGKTFDNLNRLVIPGSVVADEAEVGSLVLTGDIDSLSWDSMVKDSVYENDVVTETKTIKGALKARHLNVTGRINDLLFEEFVALTSTDPNKIVLDRNVTLDEPLNVDELHFEGLLDSSLRPNFEREWLLQDETQIITGPVTFENVFMKSGSNLMNETINNINLGKLFGRSIKINEDTKIKHLFSLGKVRAGRIDVGGTVNGAKFGESVLRAKSPTEQILTGDWFMSKGLVVNGSLSVDGFLTGLNLTRLCGLDPEENFNLIVGGSVTLRKEPNVLHKVNGVDLSEKRKGMWMRDRDTVLTGTGVTLSDVKFENKTTLEGSLNGVNLTEVSRLYLSKTQPRVISADYEFDNLIIRKLCRMRTATVAGNLNGIDLTRWAGNVLLQDEEQILRESVRFEKMETTDLNLDGKLNGLDLSTDVLRLDVEDAVVEGEKTFQAINVLNLTLAKGRTVQGVDVDAWREKAVKTAGDAVINGDLVLDNPEFNGPFTVLGKVNNITFDSDHLLLTKGNQIITGVKHFNSGNQTLKMNTLHISGQINGVDLNSLIQHQAYADQDLTFQEEKTFNRGLLTESMEVDGLFHGVNISRLCDDISNPIDINTQQEEYINLLNKTKTLIQVVQDRPFFFDYLEMVQTLKPNIEALVPTLDTQGRYLLAVFTKNTMKFMAWDDYSESFHYTDEGLYLLENVTFVTSELSDNGSLLYIETKKSAKIFEPKLLKEIEAINTSCIGSFRLEPLDKSCIFVGQKWNSSRILCSSYLMNDLQTYQWLDSKGSVQVSILNIDNETFIAAINKEIIFDRIENTLLIYRFDSTLQHFYVSHTLAEINPVALSSVSYKNEHFLVSAGGHLPESVHNSVLSIFRFDKNHKVFVRAQSIQVDTPVDVHFAILPSSQLALYVLTSNPTKPFVVFLHRGITGFVEETSGLSLYPGSRLYSYTDSTRRHFVLINGYGRGQILRAGFKGGKN